MCDRAAVLIDDEHDRKSCVQQVAFALGSRLLYRVEHFLKRHDSDNGSHDLLIICATEHWLGDGQRHLLSGTNHLWTADDKTAPVHVRQHFADALVNLFQLDHVRLKRAMQRAVDWPERECDQVWIFLKCLL